MPARRTALQLLHARLDEGRVTEQQAQDALDQAAEFEAGLFAGMNAAASWLRSHRFLYAAEMFSRAHDLQPDSSPWEPVPITTQTVPVQVLGDENDEAAVEQQQQLQEHALDTQWAEAQHDL